MKYGFLTLDDVDVENKCVLLRVDINCPIYPETKDLLDDRRIKSHIITIEELVSNNAKVVVLAHQGRPGESEFITLEKHAKRLSELLDLDVKYVDDIFGPKAREEIKKLDAGEILMLENVRFYSEEMLNRPSDVHARSVFVQKLTPLIDIFVNDAFAAAHRSHASLVGFTEVLPSYAGRVMEKEVEVLTKVLNDAKNEGKNVVIVLGGAKVKDSIRVMEKILQNNVKKILTAGVVANVFLVAKGYDIGEKNYEIIRGKGLESLICIAKNLISKYSNDKIETPIDFVFNRYVGSFTKHVDELPLPYLIVDVGPETIREYAEIIKNADIVIANGAAGIVERKEYSTGTREIIKAIADSKAYSVVGGGHLVSVIKEMGVANKINHISTGGGACMLFLAGEKLPAIRALQKAAKRMMGERISK